jgi:hypothetical protein
MNLSNQLRVQRTVKIRLGRGEGSGKGGTCQEDTTDRNLVLVILKDWF